MFKRNQIVTIHDASVYAFPRAYSTSFLIWYKLVYWLTCRFARRIVTVSCNSKKELSRYCDINIDKIDVIYEGKEQILRFDPDNSFLQKNNLVSNKYLLAVSSINPNKNFQLIVDAMEYLKDSSCKIAIAGDKNNKIFKKYTSKIDSRIIFLGYVSDVQLRALYENATCFIYPSFYEGFGLPPLEAMACGCPVIVSNTSSLPEVCGDAALYCDPSDPIGLAEKITVLINDDTLRDEMRQKGFEHVKQFSWDKCARETWEVIERTMSQWK